MASSSTTNTASSSKPTGSAPPRKPPVVQPGIGNNIIVNPCQRLNPLLDCIRNVGKEFGDIVPDFQVGRTTGVLFLSLKYHRLHPEYIHKRIEGLGYSYTLRILLLMCDVTEHQDPIRELTKTCLINNITIIVTWSNEEAAQYLATYKAFEHRPPDMIKERVDTDYAARLRAALTSISRVNKTDVETLRTAVGSFADISRASTAQLSNLPGFGQVKVRRVQDAFEKPFRNKATSALPSTASSLLPPQSTSTTVPASTSTPTPATTPSSMRDSALASLKNRPPRAPRPPSPEWDIERDVDPADLAEEGPPPVTSEGRKRAPSPVWDIELDLNVDDEIEELEREAKRHKGG